ncbi:MAG: DUF4136 domain-containing protein [Candidatus Thiodiazotropha sp. (ex Monitilora ramsayi)]|nr:DUF4136 domain-containing protein [Candidatus Thiodiazotropha sp. (ex Monitilora ramsayi)]
MTSSVSVASPELRLSADTTFSWLENGQEIHSDDRLNNTNIKGMIETSIRSTLVSLGFAFNASKDESGYQVAYTAALEKDLTDQDILSRFGLLPGYPTIDSSQSRFERGSLIIYLVDGSQRTVVWRCATQAAVDFHANQESRQKRIARIIHDMLESLPQSH